MRAGGLLRPLPLLVVRRRRRPAADDVGVVVVVGQLVVQGVFAAVEAAAAEVEVDEDDDGYEGEEGALGGGCGVSFGRGKEGGVLCRY